MVRQCSAELDELITLNPACSTGMKKYRKSALLICIGSIFLLLLAHMFGPRKVLSLWAVPHMTPSFADLRSITHGADSYSMGLDPRYENPCDPWERKLNYPQAWMLLYKLGLNSTHTFALGVFIIACFVGSTIFVLPNASNRLLLLFGIAFFSPVTMLTIERGNNDMLMFALVVAAVLASRRSQIASEGILFTSFALKYYPILGWAFFLKNKVSPFLFRTSIAVGLSVVYLFFKKEELSLINANTQRGPYYSYGLKVFPMKMEELRPLFAEFVQVASFFIVLLCILLPVLYCLKSKRFRRLDIQEDCVDFFRAGSAIYIGTFIIGHSFDYRMIFLLLTLPQLLSWSSSKPPLISAISKITIVSILISLWHQYTFVYVRSIPKVGGYIELLVDDASDWTAFAGLCILFIASLPQHVWDKLSFATTQPRL